MNMRASEPPGHEGREVTEAAKNLPQAVDEAVDRLLVELSLRDKTKLVNTDEEDLLELHFSLGMYVRNDFGLWDENTELMESCRSLSGEANLHADDASFVIIRELWEKVRESHVLRVVK